MREHTPRTRYEARRNRGARLLAAGVLAAVASFGASQVGSGSDRFQPATTTAQLILGPGGPPQEYTVTSSSDGTTTVVVRSRGHAATATRTGPVVRVGATTKG
jgi:hypothetical protein